MNPGTERDLLKLLTGRLPAREAGELRARIERDAELAGASERLAAAWDGLELAEPAPAPPGFSNRVMARVREEAAGRAPGEGLLLWAAPPAVRALAATALAAGIALGVAGVYYTDPPSGYDEPAARGEAPAQPASLADSYWDAMAADDPFESGSEEEP